MKSFRWVPLLMLVASCSRPGPEPAADPELQPLAVTQWTGKTELFAEYPPLVVGQTSRFAIHLTRLDSFKALTAALRASGSRIICMPIGRQIHLLKAALVGARRPLLKSSRGAGGNGSAAFCRLRQ